MTPDAERAALIRRIELHKQMGRGVPHKLVAKLEQLTLKALAHDVALKTIERDIAKIVRDDIATERVKAERRV